MTAQCMQCCHIWESLSCGRDLSLDHTIVICVVQALKSVCAAIEHSAGMLHSLTVCHSSTRGMSCSHGNTYVHVVWVCNGSHMCTRTHTHAHHQQPVPPHPVGVAIS